MRKACAAALLFGLTTAPATPAAAVNLAEPTMAAQDALATICLPATEKSIGPNNLAVQQGFIQDAAPPMYVQHLFPWSQLGSASFSKPVSGGTLHVVSSVAPPPSNPFSCLIALDVDAPGLVDGVKQRFSGPGTRYVYLPKASAGSPESLSYMVVLDALDGTKQTDDKIFVVSNKNQDTDHMHAFIMTFRVDPSGLAAEAGRKKMCAAGTAPPQLCQQ